MSSEIIVLTPEQLAAGVEEGVKRGLAALEPLPEVLTKKQLAAYWQISESTIYNLIKRPVNPLPHSKKIGDLRFFRTDVDAWAKSEAESKQTVGEQ